MIGTNSSGARTVAYGGTKDHVLALEIVLADGSVFPARALPRRRPRAGRPPRRRHPRRPGVRADPPRVAGERRRDRRARCPGWSRTARATGWRRDASGCGDGGARRPATAPAIASSTSRSCSSAPRAPWAWSPRPPSTWCPCRAATGSPWPTSRRCSRRARRSRASSLSGRPPWRSWTPASSPSCASTTPGWTPCSRRAPTPPCSSSSRAGTTPSSTRGSPPCAATWTAPSAIKVVRAETAEETARLWTVRKSAVALALRMPGPRRALPFIEDVTVHPTEVPGYVDFLQRLFDRGEGRRRHVRPRGRRQHPHPAPARSQGPRRPAHHAAPLRRGLRVRARAYGAPCRASTGTACSAPPTSGEMYGDDRVLPLLAGQECVRSSGPDEPRARRSGRRSETRAACSAICATASTTGPCPRSPSLHFPGERVRARDREVPRLRASARAWWRPPCAPPTRPPAGSRRRPGPRPTCCAAIITGALDPASTYGEAAAKTVTDYCIVCGMCAVECPSNVNIPKLMLEAKSKYRAAHRGVADRGRSSATPRPRRLWAAGSPRWPTRSCQPAPAPPPGGAAHRHRPAPADAALRPPDLRPDCRRAPPAPRRARLSQRRDATRRREPRPRPPAGRLLLRPLRRLQRPRNWALAVLRVLEAHGIRGRAPRAAGQRRPGDALRIRRRRPEDGRVQRRGGPALGEAGRCAADGRAHRQLRLQGPLPRLPGHPGVLAGGRRDPRPGGVPGPLPRRPSGGGAGRPAPPRLPGHR